MPHSQSKLGLALQHHQAGRLQEAESLYRQILAADPRCPDALHYLGVIAFQVGKDGVAIELMQQAEALDPRNPEILSNLGEACRRVGKLDEALRYFIRALELNPSQPGTENNLGAVLRDQGRIDEAIYWFRRAIQRQPRSYSAHANLGNALCDQRRFEAAIPSYERALALEPRAHEVQLSLGCAWQGRGRLDEAEDSFRRTLQLRPDFSAAHRNLGYVRFAQGRIDEAIACFRQACDLEPRNAGVHSDLTFTLNFAPDLDASRIHAEHVRWRERHAAHLADRVRAHPNDRTPGRRLRIGYVSPDFRNHALGFNLLPLLREHDRDQFELFCYANVRHPDVLTDRFRAQADGWRDIVNLSDDQVDNRVREDRIDVLVDLALHSPDNRLLVFARKPAPVQVTFGGYPGTTGVATIDYRLTDPYLDPPGHGEGFYSEKSWRLPDSFWCYDPLEDTSTVNPLPAQTRGYVTFGCLNSFCKVNRRVLSFWAQVLAAVPSSRVLLLSPQGRHRQETVDFLQRTGVDSARVTFSERVARAKYFERYHEIDLGLDTFPYNGHTTSLDSLWMGVPVVTMVGETVVGRAGWSQLSNLGLTEFVAHDPHQFVATAVRWSGDLNRLAEIRRTLRDRMKASPLMDAGRFARGVECAYRAIWQQWCASASR